MDHFVCLLAAGIINPPRTMPQTLSREPLFSKEITLILIIGGGVALLLFIWAFFLRKRQHPDPHARIIKGGFLDEAGADSQREQKGRHHRRRRHRRQRSRNLPRNPTLHETGGLPPLRPEDQPPSEGLTTKD
ncbi:MAG: hypothetical protein HZA90_18360 [Verrucomicrobia bacterium]|nr:hypothetical protein [Verrucomicrobiota bacterium]